MAIPLILSFKYGLPWLVVALAIKTTPMSDLNLIEVWFPNTMNKYATNKSCFKHAIKDESQSVNQKMCPK